jgi:hypothetical protein
LVSQGFMVSHLKSSFRKVSHLRSEQFDREQDADRAGAMSMNRNRSVRISEDESTETDEPASLRDIVLPFGRYYGVPLRAVEDGYLLWLGRIEIRDPKLAAAIRKEIEFRSL